MRTISFFRRSVQGSSGFRPCAEQKLVRNKARPGAKSPCGASPFPLRYSHYNIRFISVNIYFVSGLPVYAKISVDRNPPAIIDVIFQNLSRKAGAESEKTSAISFLSIAMFFVPASPCAAINRSSADALSLSILSSLRTTAHAFCFSLFFQISFIIPFFIKKGRRFVLQRPRIFLRITE